MTVPPVLPGCATAAGTQRYRDRFFQAGTGAGTYHFRQRYGLWMSSIGLGAFLGAPTDAVSQGYGRSLVAALAAGYNVIDTAPSYRHGRSEQDVGAALAQAADQGIAQRDEVIVCTKGGYVPYDWPQDARPPDAVAGIHSLDPAFLAGEIEASLCRLGLDCLDVYYLHQPEIHLNFINPGEFLQRLRRAFEGLEGEVQAGRIRFYGVACSQGLTADPADREHVPLYKLTQVAEAVAGPNHHFRFLQFPYHLGLTGAVTQSNQTVKRQANGRAERVRMPLLAAAVQLGMVSVTCGGLAQGLLAEEIPEGVGQRWAAHMGRLHGKPPTPAQVALHFNRSTPGLTTTLVGMQNPDHVAENLALAGLDPMGADRFFGLMG